MLMNPFFRSLLFLTVFFLSGFFPYKGLRAERSLEKIPWKWNHFQPALGFAFFSNLSERGATFYESYQVYPVFTLELFHPNLKVYMPNIFYRHRWNEYVLFRGGINSVQVEVPYETNEEKKDYQRKDTFEAVGFVELGLPRYGEWTFRLNQDLSEHNGMSIENRLRWIFYNLNLPGEDSELQFALSYTLGVGNKDHNTYFYGKNANEDFGISHHAMGFSISNSEDHLYPIFELRYYEVLEDKNRAASIAKDKRSGIFVQLFFVFNFNLFGSN